MKKASVKQPSKKELAQSEFEKIVATEKATVELQQFKARTTFLVSDYSQLELLDSNRVVVPNARLKEDLERFGQLDPITVKKNRNGNWSILNGQHRLLHLKGLGLPVECIEISSSFAGNDFDAIKSLNVKGKGWTKSDFTGHYIKEKNQNFMNFMCLVANYPNLTETVIYKYVKGVSGKLKQLYENGNLDFNSTPEQEKSLETLNKLLGLVKSSRVENMTRNYFDRPQIVKLIDDFIRNNEDIQMNIFEKTLRQEGYSFSKETTLESLNSLYQKYVL